MGVFVATVLCVLGASPVVADEMAWGDVSADGSTQTRSLDVPVPMARGAENFFESDPMSPHDWTHVSVVKKSLYAQISVKSGSRIKRFEDALRPIYSAMPKDDSGLLGNGTVRYALHRYFTAQKGWAMKGLQPAGGSWIKSMSVTPDVKEVSKYMVPTYLQELLLQHVGSAGIDLHSLAILVATLEHLVHGEMLDILYSIYSTIGLSTAGVRSKEEVDEILDLFMMVYAFGFNLEASTHKDMMKARRHLEDKHSGWAPLRAFAANVEKTIQQEAFDFNGVLRITEEISNHYAQWQSRDCTRAKELLTAMPGASPGRVLAQEVKSSRSPGYRSLFTESSQDLQKLGVLDSEHLVVPNYINSQSMCLSTASFYTACCPNECDNLLSSLERSVGAPVAEAAHMDKLLTSLAPGSPSRLDSLNAIASKNNGQISLHARSFAQELHAWFPTQCPQPNDMPNTNPKTADEWMNPPDEKIQDTEDMMSEIAAVLSKYTTMGEHVAPSEAPEDEVTNGTEVIVIHESQEEQTTERQPSRLVFYAIPLVSMLGLAATSVKSGLSATGMGPKEKEKWSAFDFA